MSEASELQGRRYALRMLRMTALDGEPVGDVR